jgi:hypothetical protein
LTSSARRNSLPDQRTRDAQVRNRKKSQFNKALDSLKKRKRGLDQSSSSPSEDSGNDDEEDKRAALYDSDSDAESVASKDFVVEDDEQTLQDLLEIPPEFTSLSYQGPQLKFKVVVQAEVYALLHPAYRNMDYSGRLRPPPVFDFRFYLTFTHACF